MGADAEADRTVTDALEAGRAALAREAWAEARGWFELALSRGEAPAALEGLAMAAARLSDGEAAVGARTRAYRLYQTQGDRRAAARLATWLALDHHAFRGEPATAGYWLQRAHRLLEGLGPVPEQGWLALAEGQIALLVRHDQAEAERCAAMALAVGRALGLPDLEQEGLALEQRARVEAREMAEGAHHREAAPTSATGSVSRASVAMTLPPPRRSGAGPGRGLMVVAASLAAVGVLTVGFGAARQFEQQSAATAVAAATVAVIAPASTPIAALGKTPGGLPPTSIIGGGLTAIASTASAVAMGAGPAAPTAVPVSSPPPPAAGTPSPTLSAPSPTARPSTPTATATRPSLAEVRQRVAAAEDGLRGGIFHATAEYGEGARSTATLRLDLGDGQRAPRFHVSTTYQRASEAQTVEYIVIGDQAWERLPEAEWVAIPAQEGLWDHVATFLPRVKLVPTLEAEWRGAGAAELRWYDVDQAADTTLVIDPTTGAPRQLRQVVRETGLARTVSYSSWNVPVEIVPPSLP